MYAEINPFHGNDPAKSFNNMPTEQLRLANCERVVILHNPNSTHADNGLKHIEELKQRRFGVQTKDYLLLNSRPNLEDTEHLLQEILRPNDGLVLVGGDGTISHSLTAAYNLNYSGQVLLVPAGHANDMSRTLNPKHYDSDIGRILLDGDSKRLQPFEINVSDSQKGSLIDQKLAWSYWGAGLGGHITQYLNDTAFRQQTSKLPSKYRILKDLQTGFSSTANCSSLIMLDHKNENNNGLILDVTMAKNPRMAHGLVRFGFLSLTDNTIVKVITNSPKDKHERSIARRAVKLYSAIGKAAIGKYDNKISLGQEEIFTLYSLDNQNIYTQVDGEAHQYNSGVTFTIRPQQPSKFTVLSTR